MGVVFAAKDIQLRRNVAIKAMTPALATDEGSVKRFLREARAVVSFTGEHVVRIFDVGELPNGIPYIAMEFLVGTDLDSFCAERGRLPPREAVDLLLQPTIAEARRRSASGHEAESGRQAPAKTDAAGSLRSRRGSRARDRRVRR